MRITKKRKRLKKRIELKPLEWRLIRQTMIIHTYQSCLKEAKEKIEVQSQVIEKLERQIHEEPRW